MIEPAELLTFIDPNCQRPEWVQTLRVIAALNHAEGQSIARNWSATATRVLKGGKPVFQEASFVDQWKYATSTPSHADNPLGVLIRLAQAGGYQLPRHDKTEAKTKPIDVEKDKPSHSQTQQSRDPAPPPKPERPKMTSKEVKKRLNSFGQFRSHQYLKNKNIQHLIDPVTRRKLRVADGRLIIPGLNIASELPTTYQHITADGEKAHVWNGTASGSWFSMGNYHQIIFLCEGFADAAIINHCLQGQALTACVWNAGSFKTAIRHCTDTYQESVIVAICDRGHDLRGDGVLDTVEKMNYNGVLAYLSPNFSESAGDICDLWQTDKDRTRQEIRALHEIVKKKREGHEAPQRTITPMESLKTKREQLHEQ